MCNLGFIWPVKNKVLVFIADVLAWVREMLSRILPSENYEPLWATNERGALGLSRNQQPDLLLLDFNRPLKRVMNSLELMQCASGFVPVILITENNAGFERAEAVETFRRELDHINLLLVDLNMPLRNG